MPARLNPKQDERARSAIQTTQLIKRLQMFAFGEIDPAALAKEGENAKPVEIDSNRLKAIEILLRKSLPDLSAVKMEAEIEAGQGLAAFLNAVTQKAGQNRVGCDEGD